MLMTPFALPAGKIVFTEKKKVSEAKVDFNLEHVLELESRLNQRVVGQTEAVNLVSDVIMRFAAKLNDPHKPIGVLLFVGPTGVGKTELCKALTAELLGSETKLIRLNMTDFAEGFSLTRLIGSPPGYVNHEQGGQFTEAIKQNPNSIVLLDEMEKAAPIIHKAFLSVFDEGFMIDAKNERIDCTKCLFIMTSNLASQDILNMSHHNYTSEEILAHIQSQLMHALSPELYNRVDPIVFHAMTEESLLNLIDLMLYKVKKNLKDQKKIDLTIDPSVIEYLRENGYSRELGARPLKNLIEKKVVGAISRAVVRFKIPDGAAITLIYDTDGGEWVIEWSD
jgi:ATP-dependent Clp protease ATP-binding subunit ClpB